MGEEDELQTGLSASGHRDSRGQPSCQPLPDLDTEEELAGEKGTCVGEEKERALSRQVQREWRSAAGDLGSSPATATIGPVDAARLNASSSNLRDTRTGGAPSLCHRGAHKAGRAQALLGPRMRWGTREGGHASR